MTAHAKLSARTGIPVRADSLAYEIKFVKPPQKAVLPTGCATRCTSSEVVQDSFFLHLWLLRLQRNFYSFANKLCDREC